jgi:hypothetical protein
MGPPSMSDRLLGFASSKTRDEEAFRTDSGLPTAGRST